MPEADLSLAKLVTGYSVEVTSTDRHSLAAASEMLRAGTEVYIASLPSETSERQAIAAERLKRAGLTPVPHVVARSIPNLAALDGILRKLVGEAGVDRALVLAGDRDYPAGALHSSQQIIESGLLQRNGIRRIAISAYPEPHPRIPWDALAESRAAKLEAARNAGLDVTLVSQFCFEAAPIIALARQLREERVTVPLRVGVAGNARRSALLKYALKCGVGPSIRALKENSARTRNLLLGESPRTLLEELALAHAADPALGIDGVHFFTFGSLASTVEWAEEVVTRGYAAAS